MMIEFLAAVLLVSIVLGLARSVLYELNLYRRQKRDKLIREQVEAARQRRPIPIVLHERRRVGRFCAGGSWVDPDQPDVINLQERRGRRC